MENLKNRPLQSTLYIRPGIIYMQLDNYYCLHITLELLSKMQNNYLSVHIAM